MTPVSGLVVLVVAAHSKPSGGREPVLALWCTVQKSYGFALQGVRDNTLDRVFLGDGFLHCFSLANISYERAK